MELLKATTRPTASRQKNCDHCVQAKRRCDRRAPVCSRCEEKKIPCLYSKKRLVGQPSDEQWGNIQAPLLKGSDNPALDYLEYLPAEPRPNAATVLALPSFLDGTDSNDVSMTNYLDFMTNDGVSTSEQWLVPLNDEFLVERPETPIDEEVARAYQKMAPMCNSIDTWHLYDPTSPLYYITNRIKDFTKDMATGNSTPFLHRYLYRDNTPKCILTCFSTTVLYANRTPVNTPMAMRTIQSSVRELVNAESDRVVTMPAEKLARTHALFLYQIIRLFDGDIALRAQGERHLPLLKLWLGELCKIRDNLGDLSRSEEVTVQQKPPEQWERWIFAESVRRTIIMAYSVLGLYELMKDPEHEESPNPFTYTHRWILARSLWESRTAHEFQRMWKENPQFIIANYSFESFLKHGRGDDVDEFGKIFLSVYLGPDAANEFVTTSTVQRVAVC